MNHTSSYLPAVWQRLLTWFAIAAIIFAAYWFCLRYLFPGYYAPVSAFHGDFYAYASLRDKTLTQILRFPRPAAYYATKVLGLGGLTWVMVNGIAVALANVWLTVLLVWQISRSSLLALPLSAGFYTALLFSHPDFYFEHRYDLPAQISYLFAVVSLICWNRFLERRGKATGNALLCGAILGAALFVFAKETYLLSMLCLSLGFAVSDRKNWKWHGGYVVLLMVLGTTSLVWTAHLNTAWVNVNATANDPYRIGLTPTVLGKTGWFYLSHLLNPFVLLAVAWPIFLLRKEKCLLVMALAFVAAGLAALAPHAILPNHLIESYAWVGAPLFLAPILIAAGRFGTPRNSGVMALLIVLAIIGPGGYREGYRSLELTFDVRQDQIGRHLANSVQELHAIPQGSRVLVAGLDATYVPFYTEGFMLTEFGGNVSWTLLTGPGIPVRKSNQVTRIINVSEAQLDSYDRLVTYDSEGELRSIRKISDISAAERAKPYLLVPELRSLGELTEMHPREGYRKFLAANLCMDWGLWSEAKRYLDGAAENGSASDPTYGRLSARLAEGLRTNASAVAEDTSPVKTVSLSARPMHIDTDKSGLGVTELVWTISPPRPCEVRVNSPDGQLFALASTSGSSKTNKWVKNGMKFFLQDVSGGKPLTRENTLAEVTVEVSTH